MIGANGGGEVYSAIPLYSYLSNLGFSLFYLTSVYEVEVEK